MNQTNRLWLLILVVLGAGGCARERPNLVDVRGVLTRRGEPLAEVKVRFLPDPESGTRGAGSMGVSDQWGRFELHYLPDQKKRGAIVGWHRVVLTDLTAENSSRDLEPLPCRFGEAYCEAATTPLRVEVPGDDGQTVHLAVR